MASSGLLSGPDCPMSHVVAAFHWGLANLTKNPCVTLARHLKHHVADVVFLQRRPSLACGGSVGLSSRTCLKRVSIGLIRDRQGAYANDWPTIQHSVLLRPFYPTGPITMQATSGSCCTATGFLVAATNKISVPTNPRPLVGVEPRTIGGDRSHDL